MLLPHSREEGCEILLVLASSCSRNRSPAPFVRQVGLQRGANSRGSPPVIQYTTPKAFFFVHLEAITAFPAGFRSRRGASEAAELDCKGTEAAKVSAALPSTMDCSCSQHHPMKRFTLINQHSAMLRCLFRKDVFLQKTLHLMEGFRKAVVQRGNSWPY